MGLAMVTITSLHSALFGSGHRRVVRVLRFNPACFCGPSMFRSGSVADRREVVLGYRRGCCTTSPGLLPLSSARLAERPGSEALLKLLLIGSYGASDPDDAV